MLIGTTHETSNVSTKVTKKDFVLDNASLERVNKTKFLGIIIDENLTWKYHVDSLTKTLPRNCFVLNRLKHYIPERILLTLYCTLILP